MSATAAIPISVDFSQGQDYPLTKDKFGLFNSGLVRLEHYARDIHLYDEIKPNSLRVDLWWGGGPWNPQPVSGNPGRIEYHFGQMDEMAQLLNQHRVQPCWAYCYIPGPLQSKPGAWRKLGVDPKLWGEVVGAFARHSREKGGNLRIGYHEIYNEPDNRDFFVGTRDDYFAMYREGSRAIRAADPDAVIGGPALAFTADWVAPFLEMVRGEALPLDFFSYHFYPNCWGTNSIRQVTAQMRGMLSKHPELATTEMHLNEYNSFPIDYPRLGKQDRHTLAAALLNDYEWFLSQPDLAQICWAQFQDTGGGNWSGMISIEGRRKAVFNAAAIYARMPVDRKKVRCGNEQLVGAMGSANDEMAALVVWNRSDGDQSMTLKLGDLPFRNGTLRVFRIDATHASWGDDPGQELLRAVETQDYKGASRLNWSGVLPKGCVVYLEVQKGASRTPAAHTSALQVVRELHYYPDRNSRGYAYLDKAECVARLGMAGDPESHQQVGMIVTNVPNRLRAQVATEGQLQKLDKNSLLGLRLDYATRTGYSTSVLFHGPCSGGADLYNSARDALMPWGTRRQADLVVRVRDLKSFVLVPKRHAPQDWNGRVAVSFILQNAGPEARARISLAAE